MLAAGDRTQGRRCHTVLCCGLLGVPSGRCPLESPTTCPRAVRTPRDPRGPHGLLTASFPPTTVCNTSYCPAPADCPEGSRQLLAYEEGACCPRQNCSEFPAQRWQARS